MSKVKFVRNWKLSDPDAERWFNDGIGVKSTPSPAGDFMLKNDGDDALERIMPAGIHAGTISTKHPARLASADFDLGENERALSPRQRWRIRHDALRGRKLSSQRNGIPR